MRYRLALAVFLMVLPLLLARESAAQEISLGQDGRVAVSLEHLFGVVRSETSQENGGGKTSTTSTAVSLLGSPVGGAPTGYTWPRVGIDLFLPRSASIGTSLAYFHGSGYTATGTANVFQAAPRIGAMPLKGSNLAFWARLGFVYDYVSLGAVSQSVYALSGDLALAILLDRRAAVTISLVADLPLGGTQKDTASSTMIDTKQSDFGLQVGFVFGL